MKVHPSIFFADNLERHAAELLRLRDLAPQLGAQAMRDQCFAVSLDMTRDCMAALEAGSEVFRAFRMFRTWKERHLHGWTDAKLFAQWPWVLTRLGEVGRMIFPRPKTDEAGSVLALCERTGKIIPFAKLRHVHDGQYDRLEPHRILYLDDELDEQGILGRELERSRVYERACRTAANLLREEAAKSNPTDAVADEADPCSEPPMKPDERLVFDLLQRLPVGDAMTGAEIIGALRQEKEIEQGVLTSRIIPFLKEHYGVKNRRGAGYYVDQNA